MEKKCYSSLTVIMSFFFFLVPLWAVYIIVIWPVCVYNWRLGKRVELLAEEEKQYVKKGVMSQRVYNNLTEGHCSPGWVSISFFFVSSSAKIPFVAFSWPKIWILKKREATTRVLFVDPKVVVVRGWMGKAGLKCNLFRTQNPVDCLLL